jgi:hypothetical protein
VRIQGVVLGDLARFDVADHLGGEEAVRTDRPRELAQTGARRRGDLGPPGGKRHLVDRHVGDAPVLEHQGRRLQKRRRLARRLHGPLGRDHAQGAQAGDKGQSPGCPDAKRLHALSTSCYRGSRIPERDLEARHFSHKFNYRLT